MKNLATLLLLGLLLPAGAQAADFNVGDADALAQAMRTARPGDTVVLTDGVWTDQQLVFAGRGRPEAPITLRPQTPGGVTLTGRSNLSISGAHLMVDGLNFEAGTPGDLGHVVRFSGPLGDATRCRLTNTQIKNYNPRNINTRYFWVSLYGTYNRVDHCRFENHAHPGVTVVAWIEDQPMHHHIDHNHFYLRPPGNGNGFEAIRLGDSKHHETSARITVENNLFEEVDGEMEIISNKSCDNVFRGNTFVECQGTLTLRHGHRARVVGNHFLGQGKARTGGVRVIGEDHLIVHNTFAGLDDRADAAISLAAGIANTPDNGYEQVRRALIAHNTVIDVKGAAITFDWGLGKRKRTQLPEGVTIANNLLVSTHAPLIEGSPGTNTRWLRNLAFGADLGVEPGEGLTQADPELEPLDPGNGPGDWRLAADSPARGGALTLPVLKSLGLDHPDLGAQPGYQPRSAADTGPSWIRGQP